MGLLDSLVDNLLGREDQAQKRRIDASNRRIEQNLTPLRKKAADRINQQYRSGQIDRDTYGRRFRNALGDRPNTSVRQLPNGLIVNNKKDSLGSTINKGLASGIMQIAPQRIVGSLAEYGGNLADVDAVRNFGTKLNQPFRDFNAVSGEQASNKAAYTGANVVGGLLTLPIAPAGARSAQAFRAARYGLPAAADTSFAIRQGGGSRLQQLLGGAATGGTAGYLGTVGAEKILNPANKLAGTAGRRIAQAGLYEGLEEGVESGVEDLVARTTYDPNKSLKESITDIGLSAGIGAISGGALRGGIEVGTPGGRADISRFARNTRNKVNPKAVFADDGSRQQIPGAPEGYTMDANEGLVYDPSGKEITLGELQEASQNARGDGYLTDFERASRAGDKKTMQRIAKEHPDDIRVQVGVEAKPTEAGGFLDVNPKDSEVLKAVRKLLPARATQVDNKLTNNTDPNGKPNSKQNIDQFVKQQVKAQNTEPEKLGRFKKAKRQWIDSLSPAEDNFRNAVKEGKISQETLDDIIVKNGKSLRAGTMANLNMKESGLVELMHNMPKQDYDNLGQTLIAIHSADLRANGIETGRNADTDKAIIAKYGDRFSNEIQQFRQSADYVLNKSVEHNLISQETADMLRQKYPNYVPMNRVIAELENSGSFNSSQIASLGNQTVVRKIRGSKRVVENPMESMIAKVQDMSSQGIRNDAALAWVDALSETGDAQLVTDKVGPGESTISVIRNGNKEIYKVDSEMEAAAKGLTKEQMNVVVETARKVSRVFKTGTTGLNLPFTVTNLARDQQTAFLNMQRGEAQVFKAIPETIFETLGHGELYQEAVRQGAISTSFDLTKPNAKLTAKHIRKKGSKLGVLSKIEDAVGRSEEFTRLQQYKATKEYWINQGSTEAEARTKATIAAQQNSADFARAGDFGRILNSVLPYTNAGVQGTRAYLRSATSNPQRYAIKAGATLVMPMVMAALWNYSDDDREAVMNDISEFDKQANFIIVPPWAKKNEQGKWEGLVKVPKPPGISALMYPVEQGIAQMKGNDPVAFGDITQAVLGFASPLGDNAKAAVSTITPQAVKPAIETTFNKNLFTGRDVVPRYLTNKTPAEQTYDSTSGTARKIGGVFNTSPLNVEHLIRGYGGELGLQGLNAADNALNKAGVIPEEQIGGRSIPYGFSRRFTEAYGSQDGVERGTSVTNASESAARQTISNGDFVAISNSTEKNKAGDVISRDKYDALLHAYTKSDGELKNVTKYDDKVLGAAIVEINGEAQEFLSEMGLPTDVIRYDNITARAFANYKKGDDSNSVNQVSKKRALARKLYDTAVSPEIKSLRTAKDDDIRGLIASGEVSKEMMDIAIEYDNFLVDNGLISSPSIGKTLRTDLGYALPQSTQSTTASRSSGGSSRRSSSNIASRKTGFNETDTAIRNAGALNKRVQSSKLSLPRSSFTNKIGRGRRLQAFKRPTRTRVRSA